MVAEYANEIFEYLRDLEVKSIPNPQYMSHQDDLEWRTRGILVDWLIEVHTRFHLLPETLFLAVNIIDRFLSEKVVELDKLQLVGITAMFIASKYEEVLSPHVENFKRITDDGFSEAEILEAERFLLSTLNYDLSYPNPMNFLRRVSKADNYDIQSRTIGKYLMEISLLDHRFMAYRPSHCAAAAMYLARLMLDRGEWVSGIFCGHSNNRLTPTLQDKTLAHYAAMPRKRLSLLSSSWSTILRARLFMKPFSRSTPARSSSKVCVATGSKSCLCADTLQLLFSPGSGPRRTRRFSASRIPNCRWIKSHDYDTVLARRHDARLQLGHAWLPHSASWTQPAGVVLRHDLVPDDNTSTAAVLHATVCEGVAYFLLPDTLDNS